MMLAARAAVATVLALGAFCAPAGAAGPVPAPEPVAAPGVSVGGLAVGGLTRAQIAALVREQIARPLDRRLVVAVGAKRFTIRPRDAGVSVKPEVLAARALLAPAGAAVAVVPTLKRSAAPRLMARVRRRVYVRPRNSRVLYGIRRLRASRARDGRKLARSAILEDRIAAALRSWTAPRVLRAHTRPVKARVGPRRLRTITRAIVTVSRSGRRARLFNHLRLVRTYRVAVGQPGYPTPTGLFRVRSKVVNPAWSVPNSSWAGSLAGQTVAGGAPGNPLVARWIGITSAVGFHGTDNPWSIGGAASHGCIRMYPRDVIRLYTWVRIGTPVYIR